MAHKKLIAILLYVPYLDLAQLHKKANKNKR